MLKQLDRDDTVKAIFLKFVVDYIPSDDDKIRQPFLLGLIVNEFPLRPGVGEGSNLGFWKDLGEIERS